MKMNPIIGTFILCCMAGCGFQQNRPSEILEMIGVSEIELNSSKTVESDDSGYGFFPMDGIVYNNKLSKRIKVKAALR